jgi:hypothetical protein
MKNEELAGAATDLWFLLQQVIEVYAQLEDEDDGGLGRNNRKLEKKFSHVMEWLEDLVIHVDEAAQCHAKGVDLGPPWARKDRTIKK